MKNITLVLFLAGIVTGTKAQFFTPDFTDTAGKAKDTVKVIPPQAPVINEQRIPQDDSSRLTELELKKLEMQAQKLRLEKEIAELNGKSNLSPEEKEVLKLKNNNLKIVLLKEKYILDEELAETERLSKQKNLPSGAVYGHDFFRHNAFTFYQKSNEIVATENYVLGTGDAVHLDIWGYRYWSKTYIVSESGSIDLAGYQKLFVKGLTLRRAKDLIGSRLGLNGEESSFAVTVTRPRMVSINITGEVFSPGSYSMPATNTAFNALVSMGGPSNIGSVRNIYIKRDGKISDSFDVYEYFANIHHQRDVYLQNNDYIIVMPLHNVVNVEGSIRRPGNYELKAGESITDLIRFAGGTYPNTYLKNVVITRIANNQYEVISLDLDSLIKNKKKFTFTGGEKVFFKEIQNDNNYTISIAGAVSVPGAYRVRPGMKISDLIKNANGFTSKAFLERGYLIRTNTDLSQSFYSFNPQEIISNKNSRTDIMVENRDSIYIFNSEELLQFYKVSISGSVFKPQTTRFIAGLKLGELVHMAGGLTNDADSTVAYITRTNSNLDKKLIRFNPAAVINNGDLADFELMPRDEIQIVSKTQFKRFYSLEIQGPVKNPKVITYSQNTKIGDLINLAGGLEVTAYQGRALVVVTDLKNGYKTIKTFNLQNILKNPQSAENSVLEPNSVVRIFDLSELRNNFQVSLYGEVRKPGDFDYADNMTLQNLVDLGGGLQFYAAGTSVEVVRNFNLSNGKYEFLKPKIYFTKISQELQLDSQIRSLVLQPFDRVFIRRNPDFVPFKMVYLEGAVRYPGYYALQADNEKLKSIYQRAGGFKPDADLKGIRVKRVQKTGDTMELVLNSRRAVNYKHSKYNIILHHGDRISVPYAENIVTITGDVNKLTDRDIGVYYTKHKRARFYIYTFAGGFTETSDRKHVVVIRADGSRVSTHQFLFIRTFPKVKPGSKIVVNTKPGYDKGNRPKKDPFNFDTFTQKLLTRTTAVLSLIGLYKVATK